jgi:beta-galactosidase
MTATLASTTDARRIPLNTGWLFGGEVNPPLPENWADDALAARLAAADIDESGFQEVVVPHTVSELSWRQWDHTLWEKVWTYRKHFDLADFEEGQRVFLDFEAVMTNATVTLNGVRLGQHFGGYLPFSFEVTDAVKASGNLLAVLVDSRFNLNVPPNIPIPVKSEAVDYWQPGGIYGTVNLRVVPAAYVSELVATPENVLDADARSVRVTSVVDASQALGTASLRVSLIDGAGTEIATVTSPVSIGGAGVQEIESVLSGLASVELWDVESPVLYHVVSELSVDGRAVHTESKRIGFREARFELDGFYLNGRRLYLFGANRHQHYPYAGFAMPARVQRKDAELLRNELNCVMVRCSHYPQLSSFLDACDELGLLVWEESPGWQYVGDSEWQARAADDIRSMIVRDRHRPSVIIWAPRLNETPDHPEFYSATEAMVKELDPTRATSGTTFGPYHATENYKHDVFSYDDYTIDVLPDGDHRPSLQPPKEGFPYLIAETVTSWSSPARLYRRADTALVQQHQAMDYAYAHNIARSDPRYSGVIAWSGFDYQAGHTVNYQGMKTSGMIDTFRVLKPGAAMYRAQVEASERIVLEPAFTWDPPIDRQTAPGKDNRTVGDTWGPGEKAVIFSNCDRIEVTVGGVHRASVLPDRENFPHLITPPSIVDLRMDGRETPDLLLEGYIGDELVITRRFAGDRDGDAITVTADDPQIVADGVDATRVELTVVDRFGEARGHSQARLAVEVSGPGILIGEPVFDFEYTGAVGAVWVRSIAGVPGLIAVRAAHARFGSLTATVQSIAADQA